MLRVHRIPFSTNVERVALAAAHKGLAVEWVDHDHADRSEVRALSGQDLVPVAELDGEVVVDSMRIVERLEALAPDPPLYPEDPAARARVDVFVEWFNEVCANWLDWVPLPAHSGQNSTCLFCWFARQLVEPLVLREAGVGRERRGRPVGAPQGPA